MKGNGYVHEDNWEAFKALGVTFEEVPNFNAMSDEEQAKLIRKPTDPVPTFRQMLAMPTISMASPEWHLVLFREATDEQADRLAGLLEGQVTFGPDED